MGLEGIMAKECSMYQPSLQLRPQSPAYFDSPLTPLLSKEYLVNKFNDEKQADVALEVTPDNHSASIYFDLLSGQYEHASVSYAPRGPQFNGKIIKFQSAYDLDPNGGLRGLARMVDLGNANRKVSEISTDQRSDEITETVHHEASKATGHWGDGGPDEERTTNRSFTLTYRL